MNEKILTVCVCHIPIFLKGGRCSTIFLLTSDVGVGVDTGKIIFSSRDQVTGLRLQLQMLGSVRMVGAPRNTPALHPRPRHQSYFATVNLRSWLNLSPLLFILFFTFTTGLQATQHMVLSSQQSHTVLTSSKSTFSACVKLECVRAAGFIVSRMRSYFELLNRA